MIKRNQRFLNRLNQSVDIFIIMISYVFSSWLRLFIWNGSRENIALSRHMVMAAVAYACFLVFILMLAGFYNSRRTQRMGKKAILLFVTVTATILVASALLYVFRLEDFSRGVLLTFYFVTLLLLVGKYTAMHIIFEELHARGYNIIHEVVIGYGNLAQQYALDIKNTPELGIRIDTMIPQDDGSEVIHALASHGIDEVVIALEPTEYVHVTSLIALCEKYGVKYSVLPFYNDIIPDNPEIECIGRSKLINMRVNRLENVGWATLKRSFDIIASVLGLLVLSPLLIAISIGVKLSSPGPIFFRQIRVGYRRREFQMLKFRSMRENTESDTAWSTAYDGRRTRFGALLRKTSLDELPQLINVLKGDMSLVGPRPELPHFVERFREEIPFYMVKHQVKPGITGWAQVNGYRGDTSIQKRIEMDLWYIDHWSIWLDLKILCKTFPKAMINSEQIGKECKRA